ncbi:MAG: hypothetical protein ABL888_11195 [Pirellulaceae bacterium]
MKRSCTKRLKRRSKSTNSGNGMGFESLEPRQMMAFSGAFDGTTLTLTQTTDDGVAIIDNDGVGNAFRVTDLSGSPIYVAAQNVVVNLLDGVNGLNFNLNQAHSGDVTIVAGAGDRGITFGGTLNSIGGNLSVTSGNGQQGIAPAQHTALTVGGDMSIDLGLGNDSLLLLNDLSVGGNLILDSVNQVNANAADLEIAGSIVVDNSDEDIASSFHKINATMSIIGQDFTYIGNSSVDVVSLEAMSIANDTNINLGDGITGGFASQELSIENMGLGNLTVISGDTTNSDNLTLNVFELQGSFDLNPGDGVNSTILYGASLGSSITYSGGSGVDFVSFDMPAFYPPEQNVMVSMGAGNDTFALLDGGRISNLHIDFGEDQDDFLNSYGEFTFDAQLDSLRRFSHDFDSATKTMTSTEIVNTAIGDIHVAIDPITGWYAADGGPITYAANLNINLLSGSGWNLDLNNAGGLNGDLNIDLGNGDRSLSFTGNDNSIFGDLSILGGSGSQSVTLDLFQPLSVTGDVAVDLGVRSDQISDILNGLSANSLSLTGVNYFVNQGTIDVANDLVFDVSGEVETTVFRNDQQLGVQGNMSYFGGAGEDSMILDAPAAGTGVKGDFFASLGDNVSATSQLVIMDANAEIFGKTTVLSTSTLGQDVFRAESLSELKGDVFVNLGGGPNIGNFGQTSHSNSIGYRGGEGNDTVYLRTMGLTPADFNVVLGAGDDELTLEPSTNIADLLRIDFGGGDDQFINNKGAFGWETRLLNLRGFSSFYYPIPDFLNIVQVADTGDVAFDNDGTAGAIQIDATEAAYELTPTTNLRINMLAGSSSDVAVDLVTSIAGDLVIDLSHGDRDLFMVGTANEVTGNLRIVGKDGEQTLHLAENADLAVAGNMVVNLRDGADVIDDGGNKLDIGGSLYLRNVNHYEVTNDLHVAENMVFATLWETENSRLDSDSNIQIDGFFYYLGGNGEDVVLLSDTTINGGAYVNLGLGVTSGSTQLVDLSSNTSIGGNFGVRADTATGGNHVAMDSSTLIVGNMTVNFTGSTTPNTAVLRGTWLGDYGTYRGGSSSDQVSFGATATDMYFSSLLFEGDDEFTLESTSDVQFKFIDFGSGTDSFDDEHVAIFPLNTDNLP